MKRSRLALIALLVVVLFAGGRALVGDAEAPSPAGGGQSRRIGSGFADELAKGRGSAGRLAWTPPARLDGGVTIAGSVRELRTGEPVGNVEVVFRSDAGEETTTAAADGTYRIDLAPGAYRAFVRDDSVLSVGWGDHVRLPGPPSADAIGLPDETLMPLVDARADTDGVDLSVMRGGVVRGRVVDRGGKPIAGAVVRARRGGVRPTLGTDVAESDAAGTFELKLPAGDGYQLDATHDRYAGVADGPHVELTPGETVIVTVTLTAGCVIAGRVVGPGGRPANDGAIESRWGTGEQEFAPSGRIDADGTFRWFTTDAEDVTLRAWPWKSPPSPAQRFACKDGARYEGVVFQLPDRGPELEGVLVDRSGAPVALAYIDVSPLDPGGLGQQERTDAAGRWGVFQIPAGRYRVTATAPGRGVVATTITAPQTTALRLQLGGTGRIEGTAPELANGSLEVALEACVGEAGRVGLSRERRLVAVVDHRFAIDDVPACELAIDVFWHGKGTVVEASVPAGGVAQVELALGPPRAKTVHGVVRDGAGRPVEGASVVAAVEDGEPVLAITDGAGRYSLRTVSGATIIVHSKEAGFGSSEVSTAKVDDEELDIALTPSEELEREGPEPPSEAE